MDAVNDPTLFEKITPEPEPRLPTFDLVYDVGPDEDVYGISPTECEMLIRYCDHGRNDCVDFRLPVPASPFPFSFTANLPGAIPIQGGRFEARARLEFLTSRGPISGGVVWGFSIIGQNPSKAAVKGRLGERHAQVIAYKESEFRQFDEKGAPLYKPPNSFGIMQLYSFVGPGLRSLTPQELWDWTANVDAGLHFFGEAGKLAASHIRIIDGQYPDAARLGREGLELAVYHLYKTGAFCWEWDDTAKRWNKLGDTGWADDAMRIQSLVESGNPPTGWE